MFFLHIFVDFYKEKIFYSFFWRFDHFSRSYEVPSFKFDLSGVNSVNVPNISPWPFCNFLLILWTETATPATLLKKRLWHRCCLVNFAKLLRKPFSLYRSPLGECFCMENEFLRKFYGVFDYFLRSYEVLNY